MTKATLIIWLLFVGLVSAQQVNLIKAEKIVDNTDKYLYKIDDESGAIYLGEVEVFGKPEDDIKTFDHFYQKAKSIGANAFMVLKKEGLGDSIEFDSNHYYIKLFYATSFPKETNVYYIMSSSAKERKVVINNKKEILAPRSFRKVPIRDDLDNSLSVGGLLGSKLVLTYKVDQPAQFFLIKGFNAGESNSGIQGSLNFKSGDIIVLEKSFADFLISVYDEKLK